MSSAPITMRIGYLSTLYHTSILLRGLGWLEREGIRPSWTLFGTGPAIVDALMQGRLDIGYIGLSPTVIGIGKGAAIKCIAGGHVEGTVIIANPSYRTAENDPSNLGKTLEQFKGKRLGAPRRGSLHDIFLRYYLSAYGLTRDVEVINYDWADFIPDAMVKGHIEGAAGTPPLAILAGMLLEAKVVVPPTMIWPNNPSCGIIASIDMLRSRSDLLEKFLQLHKKACGLLRNDPGTAAYHIAHTIRLVDKDFVLEALRISPKYCAALSRDFVESTLRLIPVLRELNYLSTDLDEGNIFERSLIEQAHPEPPHY